MPPTPSPETPTMLHTLSLGYPFAPRVTPPPGMSQGPNWLYQGRTDFVWPATWGVLLAGPVDTDRDRTDSWLTQYPDVAHRPTRTVIDFEAISIASDPAAARAYWTLRLWDLRQHLPHHKFFYFDGPSRGWYEPWGTVTKLMRKQQYGWMNDVFDGVCADLYPPADAPWAADCRDYFAGRMEACRVACPDLPVIAVGTLWYPFGDDPLNPTTAYDEGVPALIPLSDEHIAQTVRAAREGGADELTWWAPVPTQGDVERVQRVLGVAAQIATATAVREVTA